VLERLLAGVSPTARRGITLALIVIAWVGFLIAVLWGLLPGILFIVIGFALCWFAVATLSAKSAVVQQAPIPSEDDPVEPDDVEARVRKRLESMKPADAPKEDDAGSS